MMLVYGVGENVLKGQLSAPWFLFGASSSSFHVHFSLYIVQDGSFPALRNPSYPFDTEPGPT